MLVDNGFGRPKLSTYLDIKEGLHLQAFFLPLN